MYYMNHDAVDYFRVDFTPDESIVGGKYYPLGTFAAEALECGWNASGEIHRSLKRFQEEFQVFLVPEIHPARLRRSTPCGSCGRYWMSCRYTTSCWQVITGCPR